MSRFFISLLFIFCFCKANSQVLLKQIERAPDSTYIIGAKPNKEAVWTKRDSLFKFIPKDSIYDYQSGYFRKLRLKNGKGEVDITDADKNLAIQNGLVSFGPNGNIERQYHLGVLPKIGFGSGFDVSLWLDESTNNELGTMVSYKSNDTLFFNYKRCPSCINESWAYKIDTSSVNELQNIDTLSLVGNELRISISKDGESYKSVTLPSIPNYTAGAGIAISPSYLITNIGDLSNTNEGILTLNGTGPYSIESNTSGSGGIGINQGTGITVNRSGSTLTFNAIDFSNSNELQTISTNGAAGNISISSGNTLNLNVNDADADPNNERRRLGVASGLLVNHNIGGFTDGNGVNLVINNAGGSAITKSSSPSTDGGSITWTLPNYLLTETDPTVATHIKNISTADLVRWNTRDLQKIDTFRIVGNNIELSLERDSVGVSTITLPNYLITETDPTVATHVKAITTGDITRWNVRDLQFVDTLRVVGRNIELSLSRDSVARSIITIPSDADSIVGNERDSFYHVNKWLKVGDTIKVATNYMGVSSPLLGGGRISNFQGGVQTGIGVALAIQDATVATVTSANGGSILWTLPDASSGNEIQVIDTLEYNNSILGISLSSDNLPKKTVQIKGINSVVTANDSLYVNLTDGSQVKGRTKGDTGPQGLQGVQGAPGLQGSQGIPGQNGTNGQNAVDSFYLVAKNKWIKHLDTITGEVVNVANTSTINMSKTGSTISGVVNAGSITPSLLDRAYVGGNGTSPRIAYFSASDQLTTSPNLFFNTRLTSTTDISVNGHNIGRGGGSAQNLSFGINALQGNTTGDINFAAGINSMFVNSTGVSNLSIGNFSLVNANSSYNWSVGNYALYYLTTGSYNTAGGSEALYNATTATSNFAFGFKSLWSCTTCSDNFGLGERALFLNNGNQNTNIGNYANYSNVTGSRSNSIGFYSLYNNNASDNNAFGRSALYNNTSGTDNIGMHNYSLFSNQTGSRNVIAGGYGGYSILGNNNTGAGHEVLYNATGSGNVGIGYRAGFSETGSNRLYIENSSNSAPLIGGHFDNRRIGINTGIAGLTNTFTVTGDMRLTGSSGTAKNIMGRNSSGDISNITLGGNISLSGGVLNSAINVYTAGSGIDISSNVISSTVQGSRWTPSGGSVYRLGGNVGIGTTSPTYKLDVVGGINVDNGSADLFVDPSVSYLQSDANNQLYLYGGTGSSSGVFLKSRGTVGTTGQVLTSNGTYATWQNVPASGTTEFLGVASGLLVNHSSGFTVGNGVNLVINNAGGSAISKSSSPSNNGGAITWTLPNYLLTEVDGSTTNELITSLAYATGSASPNNGNGTNTIRIQEGGNNRDLLLPSTFYNADGTVGQRYVTVVSELGFNHGNNQVYVGQGGFGGASSSAFIWNSFTAARVQVDNLGLYIAGNGGGAGTTGQVLTNNNGRAGWSNKGFYYTSKNSNFSGVTNSGTINWTSNSLSEGPFSISGNSITLPPGGGRYSVDIYINYSLDLSSTPGTYCSNCGFSIGGEDYRTQTFLTPITQGASITAVLNGGTTYTLQPLMSISSFNSISGTVKSVIIRAL